jgi:uncharacterized membrane protein HdeD (DUF308 family)
MQTTTRNIPVWSAIPETVVEKRLGSIGSGFIVRGALAIAFGNILWAWPAPTVAVMLSLFAAFAVVDGSVALWTATKASSGERSSLVIQGIATLGAGIIGLIWPGITALALLYVIAGWAVLKGVGELALAFRGSDVVVHPVWLGIAGFLTVAFGFSMFIFPVSGALAVVTLIAVVALVTGVLNIVTGVQARRARHDLRELRQADHS